MVEKLIKELQELQEYKYKYECVQKDKRRLSNLLYQYMLIEWENQSYEEHVKLYENEYCCCCRYKNSCNRVIEGKLPKTIRKPVRSDNAYIPGRKGCEKFEWS